MKTYTIFSTRKVVFIKAENVDEAVAKFLLSVKHREIKREDVSQFIIILDEDGEEYAFWTLPSLTLLGILDLPTSLYNIEIQGVPAEKAKNILMEGMKRDIWIFHLCEKIERGEN